MIRSQLTYYTNRLQRENYKPAYLAFLRVAISCWLFKEVCINWQSLEILYGQSAFVVSKSNFINRLPGGFSVIKDHYMWFILVYLVVIFLNIFGIGRWKTGLLLFVMTYVLQEMNVSLINTGDRMARMILFYLIFADSYEYFVLVKRAPASNEQRKLQILVSNLAALSIMVQLCLAYFATGLAKINDPLWLNGEATYYALSMERFMGTPFNKWLVQQQWIDYGSNYAVLLFELCFPLLIWAKRFRKVLLIAGILFHLSIYLFLMIYGFQVVFVLIYGLFLPNRQVINFANRLGAMLKFRFR